MQASFENVRGTKVDEVRVTAPDQSPESVPVLKAARLGTPKESPRTPRRDLRVVEESPGWGASGDIRLEWPAVSAGGIGAGVTAEMRFHHPFRLWGDWRLAFGLPFGWVGCRGDCPDWGLHADDKNTAIYGTFTHIGATASVARMAAVGRWLFLPAVGFRTSVYHLGARREFADDRFAVAAGPFANLGILRARGKPPPAFDPASTARRGIELSVGALRTYGRAPRDTAWLLGIGWVFLDID